MKTKAFFISVLSLVYSVSTAFANDTTGPSSAKKPGEEMHSAVTVHQQVTPHEAASHAIDQSKTGQQHNAPLPSSTPKSSLPIHAGEKHGPAAIGGVNPGNAGKNGVINGTQIKRHP